MRNVFLVSLLVFFVVVAGGFGISWYSQAKTTKDAIERIIAKINQKQPYVTYEAIETSGFPTHVYVSIVKPRFNGRVDQALKDLGNGAVPLFATIPEWSEDVTLEGRIIVGVNAMSNHYTLGINGNWRQNSKIKGTTIAVLREQAGDTNCVLDLARNEGIFGNLWNFASLGDSKSFFQDFRLVDCSNGGGKNTDLNTHETLGSAGPMRFYITNTPQGDSQQLRVYVKMTDVEIMPAGDAMVTAYRNAFSGNDSFPIKYSLFGKQNLEIDFSYKGPTDWQKYDNNPPIDIALSKFNITSQAYNYNTTFFVKNVMEGSNRAARLAFKSELGFGDIWGTIQPDIVRGVIAQLYAETYKYKQNLTAGTATQEMVPPPFQPYLEKYTPEQMYTIVAPAVPDFHALGKLVESVDVSFQGAPDLTAGDITLTDFELSATPYGITGKGSGKLAPGRMPSADAVFVCRNCLQMIDDMVAYAARVQKAVSAFDTEKAATMNISPKLVEAVKSFLIALSEPKEEMGKQTLTYSIVSSDTGPIINGKPMDAVMTIYNQTIGEALKPPPPPPPPPTAKPKKKKAT